MRERPILFSAPMVRALLDGNKTQTRRIVKPGKWESESPEYGVSFGNCPYGQPGDRLWVREAFVQGWPLDPVTDRLLQFDADGNELPKKTWYRATDDITWSDDDGCETNVPWKPSIHMPRVASRITLEVTGVRVERLQDISEADAIAEGCKAKPFPGPWWQGYLRMDDGELIHQQAVGEAPPDWMVEPHRMRSHTDLDRSAADAYRALWDQINDSGSWDANPWVWVVEFRRIDP